MRRLCYEHYDYDDRSMTRIGCRAPIPAARVKTNVPPARNRIIRLKNFANRQNWWKKRKGYRALRNEYRRTKSSFTNWLEAKSKSCWIRVISMAFSKKSITHHIQFVSKYQRFPSFYSILVYAFCRSRPLSERVSEEITNAVAGSCYGNKSHTFVADSVSNV